MVKQKVGRCRRGVAALVALWCSVVCVKRPDNMEYIRHGLVFAKYVSDAKEVYRRHPISLATHGDSTVSAVVFVGGDHHP